MPLYLAVQCGNKEIVNLLLEEGAYVNAEYEVSSVRCNIHTQFDYFSVISFYAKLSQIDEISAIKVEVVNIQDNTSQLEVDMSFKASV